MLRLNKKKITILLIYASFFVGIPIIKNETRLIEKKIESILDKFKKNASNVKQYNLFFNQWFDAFTIMKFLKYLNN